MARLSCPSRLDQLKTTSVPWITVMGNGKISHLKAGAFSPLLVDQPQNLLILVWQLMVTSEKSPSTPEFSGWSLAVLPKSQSLQILSCSSKDAVTLKSNGNIPLILL